MQLRIYENKLYVRFEDADEIDRLRSYESLGKHIASAKLLGDEDVPPGQLWASCVLSHVNLVKLKKLKAKVWVSPTTNLPDPHTIEVLKNLRASRDLYELESKRAIEIQGGVPGPSKDYPFKMKPFAHQRPGFDFMHSMRNPAIFGDCGSGKTFIVSTFAESLIKADPSWFFIVVCPVNLIKHVWMEEVEKFTSLSAASLRMDRATPKKMLAALEEVTQQDHDIYVVNPENVRIMKKDRHKGDKVSLVIKMIRRLLKQGRKMFLVIDESSRIKSRTSSTFKVLKEVRAFAERCTIMTGTPSPNGVLDLWAQFYLLDKGETLQSSFIDFRHDYASEIMLTGVTWLSSSTGEKRTATKWVQRAGAAKEVRAVIKDRAIRFRNCADLPPSQFIIRHVEMTKEQQKLYDQIEEHLFAELTDDAGNVSAAVAAVKLMKLREITGGFVITDDKKAIPIGKDSPKMLELDSLLEQSIEDDIYSDGDELPPKAIIWAQYQWECQTLLARYAGKYGAQGLFGGISSKDKDRAIESFRKSRTCRVLVCHPASAGHGLTLTEANFAFYYSHSYNFEEFYQSTKRTHRPGQKRNVTNILLACPGTIDVDILDALSQKKDLSDLITDGVHLNDFIERRKSKVRKMDLRIDWEVPDDAPIALPQKEVATPH